jgi:hypothetical protein
MIRQYDPSIWSIEISYPLYDSSKRVLSADIICSKFIIFTIPDKTAIERNNMILDQFVIADPSCEVELQPSQNDNLYNYL